MHWDASIFSTFWTYWKWALGPPRLSLIGVLASFYRSAATVLLMTGLLGFLAFRLWQRRRIVLFFPAWFVITLAPLLPLRDHISDYYLILPFLGLAMWGGWAVVSGWNSGFPGRAAASALLAIYLAVSLPVARATTVSFYTRSQHFHTLLDGIVGLGQSQPQKTILLSGVDSDLFWSCLYHRPLRLYGITDVSILPERAGIPISSRQADETKPYFIGASDEIEALKANRAIVVDVSGREANDITEAYRAERMRASR